MDIDIDISPKTKIENIFTWPRASILKDEKLNQHPCGYYPQTIARDDLTNLAAIPYNYAEEAGYFKLDFLNLNFYQCFTSKKDIDELLQKEPDWNLLLLPSAQEKLFQLSKHPDVISEIRPKNIEEIADAMALIRPGKKVLLPLYIKDRDSTRKILFIKDENGYSFKRAHAYAYALVIVLQLHLIEQNRI